MQNITFNLETSHHHGSSLFDYFKLRKQHFVNRLNWQIPHNKNVEMDQYDNPEAHYSLVRYNGRIIGGARIAATSTVWGESTYMLRDASEGKLTSIPKGILPEVYDSPEVWECTRLVLCEKILCPETRAKALRMIVDGLVDIAAERNADKLISLSPVPLMRALRSFGHRVSRVGDMYHCKDDGRNYAVLMLSGLRNYGREVAETALAA